MTEPASSPPLVCSAKGCRRGATRALLWNNPRLHDDARRKVWLACDEHESSLGQFLRMRGFLRATIDVAELTDAHGGPAYTTGIHDRGRSDLTSRTCLSNDRATGF